VSRTTVDRQLEILQKLQDIERQNIKALAATTAAKRNDKGEKAVHRAGEQLRIGYLPTKGALVFKPLTVGKVSVLDVRGRVLYRSKVINGAADGNVTVSLPTPLGMGIYFARFEGADGILRAKISVSE
jgi:glucose dehydrogenase